MPPPPCSPQRIPQHRCPGSAIQRHHQLLQIPLLPLPPGYPPPPVPDHRPHPPPGFDHRDAANAWFPHTYFKLSCGSHDKIAQQLDALTLVIEDPIIQFKDPDKTLLRQAIATQNLNL